MKEHGKKVLRSKKCLFAEEKKSKDGSEAHDFTSAGTFCRKANRKIKILRPFDFIIISTTILLTFITFLFTPGESETVTVSVHGEIIFIGSLDTDTVFITPGGHNEITVKGGRVYMSYADCPDKTCVHMGYATPAKPIVCLPNGVIITVTGAEEADSVTW